jgi:hypothetical protein
LQNELIKREKKKSSHNRPFPQTTTCLEGGGTLHRKKIFLSADKRKKAQDKQPARPLKKIEHNGHPFFVVVVCPGQHHGHG